MLISWEELKPLYYRRKNNKVSEDYYVGKLRVVNQFFQGKEWTLDTTDAFFDHLEDDFLARKGKKISASYYNKFLSLLRTIAKKKGVTFMAEYAQRNEAADRTITPKLTQSEIERFFGFCRIYWQTVRGGGRVIKKTSEYDDFRAKLTITVLVIAARRAGELRQARWSDLDGNYLRLNDTKTGPLKIYIPDHILESMNRLKRYDHGHIFANAWGPYTLDWLNDEIRFRTASAGIQKDITGRSMRGTGITMYLKKHPLHQVAQISKHKDIKVMAEHYYDPEDREIEKIVDTNSVSPKEPTAHDLHEEIRAVLDRFRGGPLAEKVKAIDRYVLDALY